jgi:organic hydroperoxide reductase OsmC/OhrA
MIYEAQIGDLPRINMPNKILDIDRFDQIVDEAWADCPVSNRYETMDDV